MKDDETKAKALNDFINSNHRKEIIEKIIYAIKYLSGTVAVIVVALLLRQDNDK